MKALRVGLVLVCAIGVLLGSVAVWAEEGGPPKKGGRPGGFRPGGPRRGGPGAEGGLRPGGRGGPGGPFGIEFPALKEELERHRTAMQEIMQGGGMRELLRDELRELIQKGAEREEIAALVKEKAAEKAKATAAKMAAEMVQHHENMAKVFQQPGVADALAKNIIQRVVRMVAMRGRRGGRPGGPGEGPGEGPGGRRRRGPRPPRPDGKQDAPENF